MRHAHAILLAAAALLPGTAAALEILPYVGYSTISEGDCGESASAPTFGARLGGGGNQFQAGIFGAHTAVSAGACGVDVALTDFGGYLHYVLSDDTAGVNTYGIGLEAAYSSCTLDSPPGQDLDLCTGGMFSGNLFYSRRLFMSDTGFNLDTRWIPDRMVHLHVAVGYRTGSIDYDDTSTNQTFSASTSGVYATVGFNLRFAVRPRRGE